MRPSQIAREPKKAKKAPGKVAKATKAVGPERVFSRYRKIIDARYSIAINTYEAQDGLTKEVIDRVRDRLVIASTGVVSVNGQPQRLEDEYTDKNILFLAIEILSDLYMNGIKIANFRPNDQYCLECKEKILAVKKPRKRNG